MTKDEALKLALEALENNKQMHYYCENTWYSCPQHEEGCANDSVGDECNCGADKANAEIDKVITAIKEALAQPEQEPVKVLHKHEWFRTNEMKVGQMRCISCGVWGQEETPQRTWVGLTDEEIDYIYMGIRAVHHDVDSDVLCRAIEAKLKEKNT